jgi:hypothetical protein
MSVQREINFSQTKPWVFTWAICFETHKNGRSLHHVPSPIAIKQTSKLEQ